MNIYQEIYRKRWEESELAQVSNVWKILVEQFFQRMIPSESSVLDIGCGFCHFLRHLKAREKIGVDANPHVKHYAGNDITIYCTEDLALPMLEEEKFDVVFMSNLLEHLDNSKEVLNLLDRVWKLLRRGGRVIILQPNFRLLGASYFDFIDHKTILTDKSMEEALNIVGFKIEKKIIRFLPYTTKSKLPKSSSLVRLYLKLRPLWCLMGKQSLFVAVKASGEREGGISAGID